MEKELLMNDEYVDEKTSLNFQQQIRRAAKNIYECSSIDNIIGDFELKNIGDFIDFSLGENVFFKITKIDEGVFCNYIRTILVNKIEGSTTQHIDLFFSDVFDELMIVFNKYKDTIKNILYYVYSKGLDSYISFSFTQANLESLNKDIEPLINKYEKFIKEQNEIKDKALEELANFETLKYEEYKQATTKTRKNEIVDELSYKYQACDIPATKTQIKMKLEGLL